ncbi:MAG: hypothetical protein B7Z15_00940 [Rhizobiales bacterium 32-66-8]|nr:MAG: hypothetical protein B7Z15_00940 [Rhizobiales bacterium 32-66-8]
MVAPTVLDGPINAVAVQAYVKLALIPELSPRDMVLDTLGFHTGPQVRAAIEAAGAGLLYSLTAAMRSASAALDGATTLGSNIQEDRVPPRGVDSAGGRRRGRRGPC